MIDILTREVGSVLVLDISGRLTLLDKTLRETVLRCINDGSRHFVLRMSDVSYIDSCGLGELVSTYVSVRNSGGDLRLLAPSERVRNLLKITKLDTVFKTLEDATPFSDSASPMASRIAG
jgi:anti-sigma B factor antagonist